MPSCNMAVLRPDPWVSQPQSTTVALGQSALFSVTVSDADPVTYQWARNGVDISGATAKSYATPPATATDNGASFTVSVTVAYAGPPGCQGTQTYDSSPAILTVQ
jgi:beta-galactosidase